MNGLLGIKATYGRVSRSGVIPLSFSLDHVGPLTRTTHDNALVLSIISGGIKMILPVQILPFQILARI